MNSLARSWNRHVGRSKYDGPDGLTIDDEEITIGDSMARNVPSSPMLDQHFANVITHIKVSNLDRVLQIREQTHAALERLDVKRNLTKVVEKNPNGSRQFDTGSLFTWLRGIRVAPKKVRRATEEQKQVRARAVVCIRQLVAIDATACARGT